MSAPVQFMPHDTDTVRLLKLGQIATTLQDLVREIASLRRQLATLEARVTALEAP